MSYNYLPPITSATQVTPSTTYTIHGSGINGLTSANFNGWSTVAADPEINGRTLNIQGDANFEGDANFTGEVTIKGRSLSDRLDGIEQRLAILHPNKKLEEKWERLKSLGNMYRELEAEIIEKEQIWAKLKK